MKIQPKPEQAEASVKYNDAFLKARFSKPVIAMARRVEELERTHTAVAAFEASIRIAVARAQEEGGDVLHMLDQRAAELQRLTNQARQEKADFIADMNARRTAAEPMLNAFARVERELPDEIAVLESRVRDYSAARERHREALVAVGLSDAAIERAGLKPDADDLQGWQDALGKMRAQLQQARDFGSSAPFYAIQTPESAVPVTA